MFSVHSNKMLSSICFRHLFFSTSLAQYLDVKDVHAYRLICKKTKDIKLNACIDYDLFIRQQIKGLIPICDVIYTNELKINNTFIDIKNMHKNVDITTHDDFGVFVRYYNVFKSVKFNKNGKEFVLNIDSKKIQKLSEYHQRMMNNEFEGTKYYILLKCIDNIIVYFKSETMLVSAVKQWLEYVSTQDFNSESELERVFWNMLVFDRNFKQCYVHFRRLEQKKVIFIQN